MNTSPATTPASGTDPVTPIQSACEHPKHLRFHRAHQHLAPAFGSHWLALKAESFTRGFGTPLFLAAQTGIVAIWIALNAAGLWQFDLYPFILLNLAFSLQAAYAAPMILLAQTRQAERDKAHNDADAQHREALATESAERQATAAQQTGQLLVLMEQNTELTRLTKELSERIELLTTEMHRRLVASG